MIDINNVFDELKCLVVSAMVISKIIDEKSDFAASREFGGELDYNLNWQKDFNFFMNEIIKESEEMKESIEKGNDLLAMQNLAIIRGLSMNIGNLFSGLRDDIEVIISRWKEENTIE